MLADRLRGQAFSALCRSLHSRATQTAELLRTGVLPEPIDLLNDRTSEPSVHPRGDYPANQLAWRANVPAHERDFDDADPTARLSGARPG